MKLDFCVSARPGLLSWLLFALGLAAAGWVMLAWQEAAADRDAAEAQLARLQPKPVRLLGKARPVDSALLSRQRGDAVARSQLGLPWARLLENLQNTRPAGIALLSLEADGRRGDFTLSALARSHAAMLDYLTEVQRAPGLAEVSLNRHELRDAEGVPAVYFSLRGMWTQP